MQILRTLVGLASACAVAVATHAAEHPVPVASALATIERGAADSHSDAVLIMRGDDVLM
jgi:hypothetical protein